jgi:hypothetical protein
MGLTLADRCRTRSLWQSALRRVCMWRDSRFGGCSIARSRAEALAGQTEMSEAKVAMTLAEAFKTTHIPRVAGRTGDCTAWVTTHSCRAPHHTTSDVGLIGGCLVKTSPGSRGSKLALPGACIVMQGTFLQIDAHREGVGTCPRRLVAVRCQTIEWRV